MPLAFCGFSNRLAPAFTAQWFQFLQAAGLNTALLPTEPLLLAHQGQPAGAELDGFRRPVNEIAELLQIQAVARFLEQKPS